jgi:hypothetical protein
VGLSKAVGYDGGMDENPYESPQSRAEKRINVDRPILSLKRMFSSFGLVALAGVCAIRACDCVVAIVLGRGEGAYQFPFLGFLAFDIVMGALFLIFAVVIIRAPFKSSD